MNWLFIAIISYFILALVFIIDKFLLSRTALRPLSYAFYIGILGGIASLFLMPFGFSSIPLEQVVISFVAGILFVFAIFCFYKSVCLGEVSRITPIIGGAVPIFTFVLTYFFLGERLDLNQSTAFFLLVLGGIIMVWPRKKIRLISGEIKTPLINRLPLAILASLFFSGSYVMTKFIFMEQSFINGFVWIRLGGILGAVLLLFWPNAKQTIFQTSKSIKLKTSGLLIFNKTLSASSFILLSYAVYLGSVTLVNALQGVQYVFLLAIAFFLSKKFPQIIKEQISQGIVVKKIIAVLFICIGLGILVF